MQCLCFSFVHQLYVVFCAAAWTDLPGVQMQSGSDDLAGYKVMQVRGSKIEFVLIDGSGQSSVA